MREFEASVWGASFRFTQRDETPTTLKPCEHVILKRGTIIRRKFSLHHDKNGRVSITDLEA